MALGAGTRLGHYEIRSRLGAGGMGEVYLALDTELDRTVALKILPAELASNQQRMQRFIQEAKAASALNHPHILTIHEIGSSRTERPSITGETRFIAMEFIDGETLRRRMKHGHLRLDEVLEIAIQAAGALSAAHAAGIIHRDIKPENIMVRRDGYIKILDFGLAKLTEPEGLTPDTEAPTKALVNTGAGTVLGTANYMSPEQAKGKRIDLRTDLWSLGAVIYEMVTGRVPFEAETPSEVVALILNKEPPPLARYEREAPPELERIVTKALTKDREERYQTAKDLAVDLKRLKRQLDLEVEIERTVPPELRISGSVTSHSGAHAPITSAHDAAVSTASAEIHQVSSAEYIVSEIRQHKTGAALALVLLLMVVGSAGYGIYKLFGNGGAAPSFQSFKITRLTTTGKASDAVVSPDGRYVVHIVDDGGQQSLWVRQVATASNVQIVAPAETAYLGLTFSRDGDYVYYVTRDRNTPVGNLYQIPVLGGTPRKLIEDVDTPVGFSPDQTRLAFIRNEGSIGSHLIVAQADGGGEQKLATLKRPDQFLYNQARGPAWSPDAKVIACGVARTDASGAYRNVAVVDARTGALKELTSQRWFDIRRAAWLADGAGLLMVAADTPATIEAQQVYYVSYPDGFVRRVTNDLNNYYGMSLKADSSTFVTVQRVTTTNIWVAPAADAAAGRQITSGGSRVDGSMGLALLPDGRIIYFSTAGGNPDLWIMKADGSEQRQLTSNAGANVFPAVSPDGRLVAFLSFRTGTPLLWRMDTDGGNLNQLSSQPYFDQPAFSADGRWIILQPTRIYGLSKVPVEGGEPISLNQAPSQYPRVSPDGKLIACIYRETSNARYQLAILPFEGGQPVKTFDIARTFDGTRGLRWSPDGRSINYVDTRGGVSNIWSQPNEGGPPKQLTNFKSDLIFAFDLTRDGKQLVLSRGTISSDVILISETN